LRKIYANLFLEDQIMAYCETDYCLTFICIGIYFIMSAYRLPGWVKSVFGKENTNHFLASSLKYCIGSILTLRIANNKQQSNTLIREVA